MTNHPPSKESHISNQSCSLPQTAIIHIKNYKNNFFSRKGHFANCLQIRQQLLSDPGFGHLPILGKFWENDEDFGIFTLIWRSREVIVMDCRNGTIHKKKNSLER